MSQVDVDSGIENMEVDENDRREKRSLTDKVSLVYVGWMEVWCRVSGGSEFTYLHILNMCFREDGASPRMSSVNNFFTKICGKEEKVKTFYIKAAFLSQTGVWMIVENSEENVFVTYPATKWPIKV